LPDHYNLKSPAKAGESAAQPRFEARTPLREPENIVTSVTP